MEKAFAECLWGASWGRKGIFELGEPRAPRDLALQQRQRKNTARELPSKRALCTMNGFSKCFLRFYCVLIAVQWYERYLRNSPCGDELGL